MLVTMVVTMAVAMVVMVFVVGLVSGLKLAVRMRLSTRPCRLLTHRNTLSHIYTMTTMTSAVAVVVPSYLDTTTFQTITHCTE